MKFHHNRVLIFLFLSVLLGCKSSSKVEDHDTLRTIPIIQPDQSPERLLQRIDTLHLSQTDMNLMKLAETIKVEEEMNRMIQQIQTEYAHDTAFINAMAEAQEGWLKFREAHLISRFPVRERYGSAAPMCISTVKSILTRQRIEQLRGWTEGIEKGDICTGSAKFKSME